MDTPASFVKVHRELKFYKDVLEPLSGKDDDFVCEVLALIEARDSGVVWDDDLLNWEEELEVFLSGKRGGEVFRKWLKIPYVRVTAPTVSERSDGFFSFVRSIELYNPDREWDTLGRALLDLKLYDLLQVLFETIPDCKDLKVLVYS